MATGFEPLGASDPAIRRTCCVAVRGSLVGFGNGFMVEVDDGFVGFDAGGGATACCFVVDGFNDLRSRCRNGGLWLAIRMSDNDSRRQWVWSRPMSDHVPDDTRRRCWQRCTMPRLRNGAIDDNSVLISAREMFLLQQ